jgi:hypothetical protein
LGGQATIVAAAPVDPVTDLTIDRQVKKRAPSRPAAARQGPSASRPTVARDATYRGRQWVTRSRPGVDRMASAWLIRRFIDPSAEFVFASAPGDFPTAVPFDMYGAGFTHDGAQCTFEVLVRRFAISDAKVVQLAEIVHDLDLNDGAFGNPHAPTVNAVITGLRASASSDRGLLDEGIKLFEALYAGLKAPSRAAGRAKRR